MNRRRAPSFRAQAAFAAGFAAFAVGWLVWLLAAGGGLPTLSKSYRVRVVVPTTAALAPNARVTMAGVPVGRVKAVDRAGLGAVMTLKIDAGRVTPLPADSRFAVRQRTPVGENYVSIQRGSSARTLPSDATVAATQADGYVDVDQVLSVLQGAARTRTRELFETLGRSLDGRGRRLNGLLDATGRAAEDGAGVVRVLARDRRHVASLIRRIGVIARAVAERGAGLRTLASGGRTTFTALASRDRAVRSLLDALPSTLRQVRTTTRTLGAVSERAAPVVTGLATAVRGLRPAVQRLRPVAVQGRALMSELERAASPARRLLTRLRGTAAPISKVFPPLRTALCQANPALRYSKPYAPDFAQSIVGLSSAQNAYDASSHLVRVVGVVTDQALVGAPPATQSALRTLLHAGLFTRSDVIGYDPYPPPGSIGKNERGRGVTGPSGVKDRFPRIQADCPG